MNKNVGLLLLSAFILVMPIAPLISVVTNTEVANSSTNTLSQHEESLEEVRAGGYRTSPVRTEPANDIDDDLTCSSEWSCVFEQQSDSCSRVGGSALSMTQRELRKQKIVEQKLCKIQQESYDSLEKVGQIFFEIERQLGQVESELQRVSRAIGIEDLQCLELVSLKEELEKLSKFRVVLQAKMEVLAEKIVSVKKAQRDLGVALGQDSALSNVDMVFLTEEITKQRKEVEEFVVDIQLCICEAKCLSDCKAEELPARLVLLEKNEKERINTLAMLAEATELIRKSEEDAAQKQRDLDEALRCKVEVNKEMERANALKLKAARDKKASAVLRRKLEKLEEGYEVVSTDQEQKTEADKLADVRAQRILAIKQKALAESESGLILREAANARRLESEEQIAQLVAAIERTGSEAMVATARAEMAFCDVQRKKADRSIS